VKVFNELHKNHQQLVSDRTSVIEQQNENDMVKKEFDLLGEGNIFD
jgi:chaperonin cofactor prefoldin